MPVVNTQAVWYRSTLKVLKLMATAAIGALIVWATDPVHLTAWLQSSPKLAVWAPVAMALAVWLRDWWAHSPWNSANDDPEADVPPAERD